MHLARLYGITDPSLLPSDKLIQAVAAAIRGGMGTVQLRDKNASFEQILPQALELAKLCKALNAQLIINDDINLAKHCGAHGVHLGQGDTEILEARAELGNTACIGITCHDSIELAEAAQAGGASYVAFGRFFPSSTKPEAKAAPLSLIKKAKERIAIPIVAIGGIDGHNAADVIQAGADSIAVCHALFSATDTEQRARTFIQSFHSNQ